MKKHFKFLKQYDNNPKQSFVDSLRLILEEANKAPEIKLRKIFSILSGKGYAALLIILSFPFCLPIQIPGVSTPFGLILAFLGLRIAFGKRLWWPQWVLEKNVSSASVKKLIEKTIQIFQKVQKILHPRLVVFTQNPLFHRVNGILIFVLALFLSLPLPIPMTNMLCALPILCIGLGLLEDDGLFILISYFLVLLCVAFFVGLFIFGKSLLSWMHLK